MQHQKILFRFLHTFFILLSTIIFADEYHHHYVHVVYPQHNAPTSNITFSSHITTYANTSSSHKKTYPTPEQLAIVMSWMKQLCPDNIDATASQKIPLQQQQRITCITQQQTQPIPETIVAPPEIITQQKYTATDITQLEDHFFTYQQRPEWDKHTNVIDRRINALAQIKNNNQQNITQHYTISENMQHYCDAHAMDTGTLKQCDGDILQQTIHDEFVHITKKSANIWCKNKYHKAFKKTTVIIADFTDAGIACNKTQETRKALVLADACWMILDCICAAGEGLLEGAHHTVDDIIHPIRTAQNIAESIAICGYYIGKIAIEIGELSYLILAKHPDKTLQKLDTWIDTFTAIYNATKEKYSTTKTRDVIKKTVAAGTQFYATPKALHGIGKLFKCAHKHVIKIAAMPHTAKANALATPEGIIVRIADNAVEYMKNEPALSVTKPLQVANMSEFFKQPFGQMLLRKSQKTPYRYQNPIYKLTENIPGTTLKKNCFYYLDRLHGNHLEVFDHTFQCVGVYNLDGTFNQIKYDLARKNGRSIRNLIKGKQ